MKHCDILIAPRWCVPVCPADTVLESHAVVVSEGRIVDLLPLNDAMQAYQPSLVVERPDHVLIPGLVNAHTHAAMTLFRGLADDLPLEPWLNDAIWPAEKRWVSAEMVRDGTELAIAEMLKGGVTCFSDQYFFPETAAETAIDLGMRAMIGTPILDFPTSWAANAAEYLSKASELVHDTYVDHPLISSCFAPHATYSLSDDAFTELRVFADQLDIRVQIHLHETAVEIENALATTGMRPFERLASLGLVNSSLLAVHAVHLTAAEIAEMADKGVCVAHCPTSNLKLASGIAPVTALLEAGITTGIGTDGAASNNTLDMLSEMRLAALLAKAESGDASSVAAGRALQMATLDSARAIGLGDETGSIEAGKWADLACVDLSALHSQPVYDPVSQLVYTASTEQVSDVWVAGRALVENHRLTHIDMNNLMSRCTEWRDRISSSDQEKQ